MSPIGKSTCSLIVLASTVALSPVNAQGAARTSIDHLQSIAPSIGGNSAPVWSADGASLFFLSGSGLWAVGADGGAPTRMAGSLDGATQLRRSPDGRLVTFV